MKLKISQVEQYVEQDFILSKIEIALDIFIKSINDWPRPIDNFDDYEEDIEAFIFNRTTKKNIENYLKKIDVVKNPWEGEALSQVVEVFKFFENDISLKEIIQQLKEHINS